MGKIAPQDWAAAVMESPEGMTLGEWYKNLPHVRKGCMMSVIWQFLDEQSPLVEEDLLKAQEEYGLEEYRIICEEFQKRKGSTTL